MEIPPWGSLELRALEAHRVVAEITEIIASYEHGYYLPILLKIYFLKRTGNKQVSALLQSRVKKTEYQTLAGMGPHLPEGLMDITIFYSVVLGS